MQSALVAVEAVHPGDAEYAKEGNRVIVLGIRVCTTMIHDIIHVRMAANGQ